MPDKVSFSKKAIHFIDDVERVAVRMLEAADRISFRLFLYALALWDVYKYFIASHR
jgi:hypothetical protein